MNARITRQDAANHFGKHVAGQHHPRAKALLDGFFGGKTTKPFDLDLIYTESSEMPGFVVLRHPLPGGGYVESDPLPLSWVPGYQLGRANPSWWNVAVRQLRKRFDAAVEAGAA